ncbi:MAG: glycosyltransferase family 4 protein [Anaerolineae bacterium]|jgi:glycosyltransferase involved in cell wall biosynthesis
MSRPRALIVEPAGNLWGSERVLLDFLVAVAGSPWQIAVCCPPDTPIVDRLAALPVTVYPAFVAGLHHKGKAQRLWAAAGLLVAALRFRPRLLYVNQAGATRIALLVARVLRIPVIAHVRLTEDAAYIQALHASVAELPVVLSISHYIQDLFEERVSDTQRRMEVIYSAYRPQQDWDDAPLSQPFGPEPMLACVGRLTKSKGQDVVLQAIGELNRQGVLAHGHFFGTGEPGDSFGLELEELAADLGLGEQIHWHGYQEKIPSRIAPMAALICPSYLEALGRVIFEAWDAGTIPVAWAGAGGPAEVIRDSEAGFLYAEQTGKSLAHTLQRVLELSPSARQQMVERGRKWLSTNCDPMAYGERMLALWGEASKLP